MRDTKLQAKQPDTMLSDNIKKLMDKHDLSESALARKTGIPQTTLSRLIVGSTQNPSFNLIMQLAEFFEVTVEQLSGRAPLPSKLNNRMETFPAPVLDWQQAMVYNEILDDDSDAEITQWVSVDCKHSHQCFALTTTSTMEPRYRAGNLLTVDPKKQPSDGDYVIVHYPETQAATIRKIIMDGPNISLQSINQINQADSLNSNINVIGVVVAYFEPDY